MAMVILTMRFRLRSVILLVSHITVSRDFSLYLEPLAS